MERKDLLLENAKIFTAQGAALNTVASRDVKVLVVGNPANTNAYIAMKSAPDLPAEELHRDAAPRPQPRAVAAGQQGRGSRSADIDKLIVWGNHSPDDVSGLPLRHRRRRVAEGQRSTTPTGTRNTFIPQVGKRGAAIIEARGLSSAASAANAAIDHIRDWVLGTNGKWVTMGVPSDGSYGIPEGVMYGVPVTSPGRRVRHRVEGLPIDDFSRETMDKTLAELEEERAGVAHLLLSRTAKAARSPSVASGHRDASSLSCEEPMTQQLRRRALPRRRRPKSRRCR